MCSDENVQALTTHTTMNLLWSAEGRKSCLIFNRWVQMSVGNIQLAKSIFSAASLPCLERVMEAVLKEAVLACAMHLWRDAKPGPCIERQPFWIHSTDGKFGLSKSLLSLLSGLARTLWLGKVKGLGLWDKVTIYAGKIFSSTWMSPGCSCNKEGKCYFIM